MRIIVKTASKKYPIIVEHNAFKKFKFPNNSIVVTDHNVLKKYASLLKPFDVVSFEPGEQSKHLETIEGLAEGLVELGVDRTNSLIAFGGGVVGDVAGFLAATYMRGIPFYQVPTSLLAMVDASVGGKTAVDLPSGKNLVGAFHQPEAVIIDPTVLQDLPNDQFRNGMGEVVKHGVLNATLFRWLERNADAINQRDVDVLTTMLAKNIKLKASIIAKDEKEQGIRMLVNLGHTFGHALEQLSEYTVPHGEAVAMGMMYAAHYVKMPDLDRIEQLLYSFGLPSRLEDPFTAKQMVKVMQADKKNKGHKITLVLPHAIGDVRIKKNVTSKQIETFLCTYEG